MNSEEDSLLNVKQVAQKVAFSVRKVWRDVAAGEFPEPRKYGAKTTRWWESEIEKFRRGEWPGHNAH
jgi:predicted DNA-binding transcriptional regulator AlpA